MNEQKRSVIQYRLQRANETLEEASLLLSSGHLNGAMNRIYYAMFYGVITLLITKDLSSSRHSTVISLFEDHFVRTGIFPKELSVNLGRAFELSSRSDYRDLVVPERLQLDDLLGNARLFVAKVEEIVRPILTSGGTLT